MTAVLLIAVLLSLTCISISVSAVAPAQTVHIVWSNHLDVGYYTPDGKGFSAAAAIGQYMSLYFTNAIAVANAFRSSNTTDRYIWTTHSWLVSLYFDCPPNMGFYCPNATERSAVQAAIQRGDITWHAFPFNSEGELHTVELLVSGINLSKELAVRLGRAGGAPNTISQRDVPGTTRAIVPILAANGIKAFSIGANGLPAAVGAARASLWVESASNTSAYLLFHPFGYGGDAISDAVIVDGLNDILIMYWEQDNRGPSSYQTAQTVLAAVRQEFPNATVKTSTFDDWINILDAAVRAGTAKLPVITDAEFSDTWIYGSGADPLKMSKTRAMARAHQYCVQDPQCDSTSPAFANFSRLLLKSYEHTWGGANSVALGGGFDDNSTDFFKWSNAAFHTSINDPGFQTLISTWVEQRQWAIDFALQALPEGHPVLTHSLQEFQHLIPTMPDLADYYDVTNRGYTEWNTGNYFITFDPKTASIISLTNKDRSIIYADTNHTLGDLLYKSYIVADFNQNIHEYASACDNTHTQCGGWSFDFGKIYLDDFVPNIQRQTIQPVITAIYIKNSTNNNNIDIEIINSIIIYLSFNTDNYHCITNYGCPVSAIIQYDFSLNTPNIFNIRLTWFNKTATRIPEAIWFNFNPIIPKSSSSTTLLVKKFNSFINADNTLTGGTRHLHATAELVSVPGYISLVAIDSPLLSLGLESRTVSTILEATPFPTPLAKTNDKTMTSGVGFNLFNNIWNTNYPTWSPYLEEDKSCVFRFRILLEQEETVHYNNNNNNNNNNMNAAVL